MGGRIIPRSILPILPIISHLATFFLFSFLSAILLMPRPSKPSDYSDRVPPPVVGQVKVQYGPSSTSNVAIGERSTNINRANSIDLGLDTSTLASGQQIEISYIDGAAKVPVRIGWRLAEFDSRTGYTYTNQGPSDLTAGSSLTWAATPIPPPPSDPAAPWIFSKKDNFKLWRAVS